jgi:hypothetical protein
MKVNVTKLTDAALLRQAASYTTGKPCNMTLARAYASQHSIIRTQIFFVTLEDIPLFVASQLVRTHVGVQFFQRSKRTDRGGLDFTDECREICDTVLLECMENDMPSVATVNRISDLPKKCDRMAPTDLAFICNAEMIINTSHKRLCTKASEETREVWAKVVDAIASIDIDLAEHCVPACIYRGGICGEPRCCKFYASPQGQNVLNSYKKLFEK